MKNTLRLIAIAALSLSAARAEETKPSTGTVLAIELKPSTDTAKPLAYDKEQFTAKVGEKIKVTVNNVGGILPQPHNFVLCKPDTGGKVIGASMQMMTDPNGMAKAYVPEISEVVASTKFAQIGMAESVEFTITEPGDYPFFCTYPGHAAIMKGVLKVTK